MMKARLSELGTKALPIDLGMKPMAVTIVTLENRTVRPVVQRFVEQVRAVAKALSDA